MRRHRRRRNARVCRRLARRDPAVDVENLPGDEGARRRAEQQSGTDDIVSLAHPSERNPVDDLLVRGRIVKLVFRHRGAHDGGRDTVDRDVVPRQFHRVLFWA